MTAKLKIAVHQQMMGIDRLFLARREDVRNGIGKGTLVHA
jgi:hypothetical protein